MASAYLIAKVCEKNMKVIYTTQLIEAIISDLKRIQEQNEHDIRFWTNILHAVEDVGPVVIER